MKPVFLYTYIIKKVLKYGEQDVVFVNFVWVILEVTLIQTKPAYEIKDIFALFTRRHFEFLFSMLKYNAI